MGKQKFYGGSAAYKVGQGGTVLLSKVVDKKSVEFDFGDRKRVHPDALNIAPGARTRKIVKKWLFQKTVYFCLFIACGTCLATFRKENSAYGRPRLKKSRKVTNSWL